MKATRALRILHVASGRQWGGREIQVTALAAGLGAGGHHPAIAATAGSPLAERAGAAGIEVARLPAGLPGRLAALRRLIGSGRWDAVHLHDAASVKSLSWACLWRALPPRVLTVRGDVAYGGRVVRAGRVSHVIAVSEWVWSALVRAGFDEAKISVIHTGVDLKRFTAEPSVTRRLREAGRRSLGLAEGEFVVGTVTSTGTQSGVEHLIEAGRRIRSGETAPGEAKLKLVVAGGRHDEVDLQQAARRAGMTGAVVFAGWRDDLPEVMAALDVYVHPATSGDAFPVSLREAMAAGVPVVASDLMGIREIVDNGKHGLIVPPADAAALALNIMRLRRDPSLAHELGRGGSLKVQRYGLQSMVDRTEELYFRLVK